MATDVPLHAVSSDVVHPQMPTNDHTEFDLNEFQDLSLLESSDDDEADPAVPTSSDHKSAANTTNIETDPPHHTTSIAATVSSGSNGNTTSHPPPPVPSSPSPTKFIHSKAALRNLQSKAGHKRKHIRDRVIGAISHKNKAPNSEGMSFDILIHFIFHRGPFHHMIHCKWHRALSS